MYKVRPEDKNKGEAAAAASTTARRNFICALAFDGFIVLYLGLSDDISRRGVLTTHCEATGNYLL